MNPATPGEGSHMGRPRHVTPIIAVVTLLALSLGGCSIEDGRPPELTLPHIDIDVYQARLASCLQEYGFSPTVEPDGLEIYVGDQGEFAMLALSECDDLLRDEGVLPPDIPLNDAQQRLMYRRLVELTECLAANDLSYAEPVSEALYVETSGEAWHPFDAQSYRSAEYLAHALEVCPTDSG